MTQIKNTWPYLVAPMAFIQFVFSIYAKTKEKNLKLIDKVFV